MLLSVFPAIADEQDRYDFKKAAHKILKVKQLKDADSFDKFWKWVETNKDLKAEALTMLETLSKKDRAYIDNLLNGGLDNADYATAIAIIAGHLESHPEEYNRVVEIFNESELPVGLKMKYGDTVMYNPREEWDKEHEKMKEFDSIEDLRDKIEQGIGKVHDKLKNLNNRKEQTVTASKNR